MQVLHQGAEWHKGARKIYKGAGLSRADSSADIITDIIADIITDIILFVYVRKHRHSHSERRFCRHQKGGGP